jgi:hypothetical protein
MYTCLHPICGRDFSPSTRLPLTTCNRSHLVILAQSDIQGTNYNPSGASWSERVGPHRRWGSNAQVCSCWDAVHNAVCAVLWFRVWGDLPPMANTLSTAANPRTLEYLRAYYQDMRPKQMCESRRTYKRRVQDRFRVLAGKNLVSLSVRIMDMSPLISLHLVRGTCPGQLSMMRDALCGKWWSTISWPRIWGWIVLISGQLTAVHSLDQPNTLLYPLTEVGASVCFWTCTGNQIDMNHRTTHQPIFHELLLWSSKTWPHPKHQATLWFLSYMVSMW